MCEREDSSNGLSVRIKKNEKKKFKKRKYMGIWRRIIDLGCSKKKVSSCEVRFGNIII